MKSNKDAKAEELRQKREQRELEKKEREERKRQLETERKEKKEQAEREREAKRRKLDAEKQAREEIKLREQKEREEQRLKKEEEKRKKEEEKRKKDEEKRKKDEERQKKEEEKQKKLDEKRQQEELRLKKELEEKEKKEKAQNRFRSFFKQESKSSNCNATELNNSDSAATFLFKPFQLQPNQSFAQLVPEHVKSKFDFKKMDFMIERQNCNEDELYLGQLKNGYSFYKYENSGNQHDDVIVVNESLKYRAKLFQFHENNRPPYFGTWRKKAVKISGRNPFARDEIFNYEVDSDDEWEEEEKGESLKDADSELSEEEGDGYELDDMFVSHGYLSDDEQRDENTSEVDRRGILTKEEMLIDERKKPLKTLVPVIIGCVWRNTAADDKCLKILEQYRATYLTV